MRPQSFFLLLGICISGLLKTTAAYSQQDSKVAYTASIPLLFNRTEVTNLIGPTRQIAGTGIDYGLNFEMKYALNSKLYFLVGVGYMIQTFNIHRPFDYPSITQPLYTTKSYSYGAVALSGGFGYSVRLKNKWTIKIPISYQAKYTLKQNYTPETNNPTLVLKDSKFFGHTILISPGIYKKVSNATSLGINVLFPAMVRWRKDAIFRENPDQYYSPRFIGGLSFSAAFAL